MPGAFLISPAAAAGSAAAGSSAACSCEQPAKPSAAARIPSRIVFLAVIAIFILLPHFIFRSMPCSSVGFFGADSLLVTEKFTTNGDVVGD